MSISNKKQLVPIHSLKDRTDLGIQIHHVDHMMSKDLSAMGAHRDDHYIFIYVNEGETTLIVDFEEVHIKAPGIAFISPGQIHQPQDIVQASGWFMAVETSMIPSKHRDLFESQLFPTFMEVDDPYRALCLHSLALIGTYFDLVTNEGSNYNKEIISSSMATFTGLMTEIFKETYKDKPISDDRAFSIVSSFRKLVALNFRHLKRPSDYADLLCISPSYLNEVVKRSTGFTVTYWIRNEVMLEARRLLYYTNATVKEIASVLGYDDHTYFIRLFSQDSATSPLQFRRNYRK